MPEAVPSDTKAKVISRWLSGESKEKISAFTSLAPSEVVSIINQWKRDLGSALADAYRTVASNPDVVGVRHETEGAEANSASPADIIRAFRMMIVFKTLGLEPDEAESFVTRLYKLNMKTGLTPERLGNTVKQVLKLAELDGIELHQIPSHVEGLTMLKKQLESDIEDLSKRKESIEHVIAESIPSKVEEIREQQGQHNNTDVLLNNVSSETLSELVRMNRKLEERGLSLQDVSEFVRMVDNAKRHSYDFAKIVDLLSTIESVEQTRAGLNNELTKLSNRAEILSSNERAMDDEVSHGESHINSIRKLSEMGFESQDFELIYSRIEKIAEVHRLDHHAAKEKFFQELQAEVNDNVKMTPSSLVAPTTATQKDVDRQLEGRGLLLRNPTERGKKIPDEQNPEYIEVLHMLQRLKSNGITEQTIVKCTIINDLFRIDLDSLTDELRRYGSLTKAMEQLGDARKNLESEELLLKHKILALEEQRQRIMTLIKESMKQSPTQITNSTAQSGNEYTEFSALVRAANGEKVSPEELLESLSIAVEMICKTLDKNSITRKIMEHAKLSLKHEPNM